MTKYINLPRNRTEAANAPSPIINCVFTCVCVCIRYIHICIYDVRYQKLAFA